MLLNEVLLFHLTDEEMKRYADLFVMRQEAKDVMKIFRKKYNTLKSAIAKLEKKYGKSSEYIHNGHRQPEIDQTKNFVLAMILQIENKYRHIELSLRQSKERQKHFTTLLHKLPVDSLKYKGAASGKISDLLYHITYARDKTLGATDDIRIANKYLGDIIQHLKWEEERRIFELKYPPVSSSVPIPIT